MRPKSPALVFAVLLELSLTLSSAPAQINFIAPPGAGASIASAPDYATEVLHNPWDMDSGQDLADYFTQENAGTGLANLAFTNGLMHFDIIHMDSAYFHMLSPGIASSNPLGKNGQALPIDSTKYRYLTIRMHSNSGDSMNVLWYTTPSGPGVKYRRSAGVNIEVGWHTYVIDLESIGYIENGNGETRTWSQAQRVTGLRIDPGGVGASASNPLHRQIDWITLTAALPPAAAYDLEYTISPTSGHYSLAIDDDSDPFNGVLKWVVRDAAGAPGNLSSQTDATGLFYGADLAVGFVSSDFATLNFGNPWDFAGSDDFNELFSLSGSLSSGSLVGTTANSSAYVRLNEHGTSFNGTNYPSVCLEATLSQAGTLCVLSNGGNHCTPAYAGRNRYDIDMSGIWRGQDINVFAINPINAAGVNYELHWVSVAHDNCSSSDILPAAASSAGPLTVNRPPELEILQPDAKGGLDFAASVLGQPWNFGNPDNIHSLHNLSYAAIYPNNVRYGRQGDFFCAANENGNIDPYHELFWVPTNSPLRIPARFRNVSTTFYVDRAQDENSGSTLRIIAGNFARDGEWHYLNGDDTFYQGQRWVTLTQDMTKWQLEAVLHPHPPQPIWDGFFNAFRVDIEEALETTYYCMDRVEVREDDKAANQFALVYALDDQDSAPGDVSVSFFYSTVEKATSGGTAIAGAQNLALTRDSRVVLFDTSAPLLDDVYYVYAVATDGINTIAVPASGRLLVEHASTPDSTAPVLQLDNPVDGRNQYAQSGMVASGYALDEIQLGLVEVLIDGVLFHSWVPDEFNKAARSAHSSWADSSNAGFFETISLSSLAPGPHTALFRAFDTTGNRTEISRSFVLQSGSDPNPIQRPAAENEDPLLLLTSPPALSGTLTKKGNLTLTISNADQCSTNLRLSAALSRKALNSSKARQLLTLSPDGSPLLIVRSKSRLLKMTSFGNDSSVYLGVSCGSSKPSSVKRIRPGSIKSKKGKPKTKYLRYLSSALQAG